MQVTRFSISNYILSLPKWKKMLFLFVLVFMICIPHTFAFTQKINESMYDCIVEGPSGMILSYLTNLEVNEGEITERDSSLINVILGKKVKSGVGLSTWDFSNQMDVVKGIEKVCEAIGYALVFIYAVEGVFRKLEQGRDFKQSVIRTAIIFLLSILLIANIKRIIYFIIDLSYWILKILISNSFVKTDGDFKKENIPGGFGEFFRLVMPWFASWISRFMVGMQCLSTIVELGIRTAFAPWAFADIMSEGFRSAGILNMQRYLALFVRIGIMVAIVVFTSELSTACKNLGGTEFIILQTTLALSTTQILGRAAEWANQIIGVS